MVITKDGGTAKVTALEELPGIWRYHLESDNGEIGGLDTLSPLQDVEVGDQFDYEGAFQTPDRISFGGQTLWTRPEKN